MAITLHHSQVAAPWPNGFAVLAGHDSGNLVQVSQVMRSPGCEELRQSNNAQNWMPSAARKVCWAGI